MSFSQRLVFGGGFTGAGTAYVSTGYTGLKGSQVALNGVTANSTASTAGLVFPMGALDVEWDSFGALVETNLTTSTITASTKFQGSIDATNWFDIVNLNGVAKLTIAAAGTGSLITTLYFHPLSGINIPLRYIRAAVVDGVATGAAGDNVTISYCFRKRLSSAA